MGGLWGARLVVAVSLSVSPSLGQQISPTGRLTFTANSGTSCELVSNSTTQCIRSTTSQSGPHFCTFGLSTTTSAVLVAYHRSLDVPNARGTRSQDTGTIGCTNGYLRTGNSFRCGLWPLAPAIGESGTIFVWSVTSSHVATSSFSVCVNSQVTGAPTSTAPTSPRSRAPTSEAPTSAAPSSLSPTFGAPSSVAPSSVSPTDGSFPPTSVAPSSGAPSSEAPSVGTPQPTSVAPSSGAPSSVAPSSAAPSVGTPQPTSRAPIPSLVPPSVGPTSPPSPLGTSTPAPTTATSQPTALTGAPVTGTPTSTPPTSMAPASVAPVTATPTDVDPFRTPTRPPVAQVSLAPSLNPTSVPSPAQVSGPTAAPSQPVSTSDSTGGGGGGGFLIIVIVVVAVVVLGATFVALRCRGKESPNPRKTLQPNPTFAPFEFGGPQSAAYETPVTLNPEYTGSGTAPPAGFSSATYEKPVPLNPEYSPSPKYAVMQSGTVPPAGLGGYEVPASRQPEYAAPRGHRAASDLDDQKYVAWSAESTSA